MNLFAFASLRKGKPLAFVASTFCISPALINKLYDFVSTIAYIPNETLALNFAGEKRFSAINFNKFKEFADTAKLSKKLIMEEVELSINAFSKAWEKVDALPLRNKVKMLSIFI